MTAREEAAAALSPHPETAPEDPVADRSCGDSDACVPDGFRDPEADRPLRSRSERRCGFAVGELEVEIAEAGYAQRLARAPGPAGGGPGGERAAIPVWFHVITDGTPAADVTDGQISQQLAVLNDAFSNAGFAFAHAGTTRTVNAAWYTMEPGSDAEKQAKAALREGDAATLNIYSAYLGEAFIGWATPPWWYEDGPDDDGVVVLNESFPGGDEAPYNLGDSATHEVGHWLGLYHTFQGKCSNQNDHVADTPREHSPAYGCPVGRDTCNKNSPDPITNYMDYSDNDCMNTFSPGQVARMQSQFAIYR